MVKVRFIENGKEKEREFDTEEDGMKFKSELKSKGIKGKWEW